MKNLIITLIVLGLLFIPSSYAQSIILSKDVYNPGDSISATASVSAGIQVTLQLINPKDVRVAVMQVQSEDDGKAYFTNIYSFTENDLEGTWTVKVYDLLTGITYEEHFKFLALQEQELEEVSEQEPFNQTESSDLSEETVEEEVHISNPSEATIETVQRDINMLRREFSELKDSITQPQLVTELENLDLRLKEIEVTLQTLEEEYRGKIKVEYPEIGNLEQLVPTTYITVFLIVLLMILVVIKDYIIKPK